MTSNNDQMDEMKVENIFPIVSIEALTRKYINGNVSPDEIHEDEEIKHIQTQLTDAFTEWGFVYMVDHGIEADDAFRVSREFFEKDNSFKSQYIGNDWGYVPFKLEKFDKQRPPELKELFYLSTPYNLSDDKLDGIKEYMDVGSQFDEKCKILSTMLLRVMGGAVSSNNKNVLLEKHRHIGNFHLNRSRLKFLYYPSIGNEEDVLENQLRCGEHSDFGTITLLFQDKTGGLQVVSPSGEYVDAVPIPGSIIVNIGDMTEIWSSGKLKSTRHRVLIDGRHEKARQSIAYFVDADNDAEICRPDGLGNVETMTAHDYLMKRLNDINGTK